MLIIVLHYDLTIPTIKPKITQSQPHAFSRSTIIFYSLFILHGFDPVHLSRPRLNEGAHDTSYGKGNQPRKIVVLPPIFRMGLVLAQFA